MFAKDELNEAAESAVSAALGAIGAGALAPILGKALGVSQAMPSTRIFGTLVAGLKRRHRHAEGSDTGGRGPPGSDSGDIRQTGSTSSPSRKPATSSN